MLPNWRCIRWDAMQVERGRFFLAFQFLAAYRFSVITPCPILFPKSITRKWDGMNSEDTQTTATLAKADFPRGTLRENLKPDEVLCEHCTGLCCRYFALPIETPTTGEDFDNLRWYMMHGEVSLFVDDEVWYLMIHADCQHLLSDYRCGIYQTRPAICRSYSTKSCEFDRDSCYEQLFETPAQLVEYAEAVLPSVVDASLDHHEVTLPILGELLSEV